MPVLSSGWAAVPLSGRWHWQLARQNPGLNYSIDAPLHFTGGVRHALSELFRLYQDAQTPLYRSHQQHAVCGARQRQTGRLTMGWSLSLVMALTVALTWFHNSSTHRVTVYSEQAEMRERAWEMVRPS